MIKVNNQPIDIQHFPDGTPKISIDPRILHGIKDHNPPTIHITWKYESDAELTYLFYITEHIKTKLTNPVLHLTLAYVPNARFDRVKTDDEVFTLKHFATLLNHMGFATVRTLDVHSNVAKALINHIDDRDITAYIRVVLRLISSQRTNDAFNMKYGLNLCPTNTENIVFFFPDEGAMKRYASLSNEFDIPYVFGMKNRDWKSGQILGLDICNPSNLDLKDKTVLIIDDICSKGGTFYHSAKKLQEYEPKEIYLYVSHCEDTILDGELIESGLVKEIFTTPSLLTIKHPRITIV